MDSLQKYLKVNIFICCIGYYKFLNGTTSNIDKIRFQNEVLEQWNSSTNCGKKPRKYQNERFEAATDDNLQKLKSRKIYHDSESDSNSDRIYDDSVDSDDICEDTNNKNSNSNQLHDIDDVGDQQNAKPIKPYEIDRPDWSLLYKPLSLYKAITRYHNCNWIAMMLLFYHLTFLLYLIVKSISSAYFAYKLKSKRVVIHDYYRPLMHYMEPTFNVNLVLTGLLCYMIFIRVNFFIYLIINSIINEKKYVFIKPSQIMIGYISLFYLTPREYGELLQECREHDSLLHKKDENFLQLHYSSTISPNTIDYDKIKRLDRIYQRYYVTMIDSQACHKKANKYLLDPKKDTSWCRSWHRSEPIQLCDLTYLHYMLLWTIFGGLFITAALFLAYGVTFYMHFTFNYYNYSYRELATGNYHQLNNTKERIEDYLLFNKSSLIYSYEQQPLNQYQIQQQQQPRLIRLSNYSKNSTFIPKYIPFKYMTLNYMLNKWLTITNVICLTDDILFLTGQTAMYLDCSCILYCVILYYSRVMKVKQFLEYKLVQIRKACINRNEPFIDEHKLNIQMMDSCEKLGLLLDEIVDMQHEWSNFIDILVMTNIIILSFNLVFFRGVCVDINEYIFSYLSILNALAPLWITLVTGSIAGRGWPKIYYLIHKLMVNQGQYLDYSIISSFLKISKRLEYEGNRSFLLLHKYGVTPLTLLTTMGWVSSAVLVLYKTAIY